jgi:hypothetical protein
MELKEKINTLSTLSKFKVSAVLNDFFGFNIKTVFITNSEAFVVTKSDLVYQMQIDESLISSGEMKIIPKLCKKCVIDFSYGEDHIVARTQTNDIYTWGSNRFGQLGNGFFDLHNHEPEMVESLKTVNIISISCGDYHTIALSDNDEVYAWGSNEFGQIGIPFTSEFHSIPYKLSMPENEKVIAIASGARHCMALTEKNHVYGWGDYEQMSLRNTENMCSKGPVKIYHEKDSIIKLACGSYHNVLLSCMGDIYILGRNDKGQLGNACSSNNGNFIKLITDKKFIDVAAHSKYSISAALTESDSYYIWGIINNQVIKEPKEISLHSFFDIFAEYFQITYKPIIVKFDINEQDQKISRYHTEFTEICPIKQIIHGSYYKACCKTDGVLYAIKQISLEKSRENELKKKYEYTRSILKEYDCQFLVKYFDTWLEENYILTDGFKNKQLKLFLNIQMDLCDKNLPDIFDEFKEDFLMREDGHLSLIGFFIACDIFLQILKGVEYLHKKNIVHENLKSSKVLLKLSGNGDYVKVSGLDEEFRGFSKQFHSIGKIYEKSTAPEIFNNYSYTTSADIWSLGMILLELFDIEIDR